MEAKPEAKAVYVCEFRHPHFGWLAHDTEFKTREEAEAYNVRQGRSYRRWVVKVERSEHAQA